MRELSILQETDFTEDEECWRPTRTQQVIVYGMLGEVTSHTLK